MAAKVSWQDSLTLLASLLSSRPGRDAHWNRTGMICDRSNVTDTPARPRLAPGAQAPSPPPPRRPEVRAHFAAPAARNDSLFMRQRYSPSQPSTGLTTHRPVQVVGMDPAPARPEMAATVVVGGDACPRYSAPLAPLAPGASLRVTRPRRSAPWADLIVARRQNGNSSTIGSTPLARRADPPARATR